METWQRLDYFPNYSVSDQGRVRNDKTGRILTQVVNQQGIPSVSLYRDGKQHRLSVIRLVAHSFLTPHPYEAFDTPINLDGDRLNNAVTNLLWRPRWFAMAYHKQFRHPRHYHDDPIEEIHTGERFNNVWEVAKKYGLIAVEVKVSTITHRTVWPTSQSFRLVN